MQIGATPPFWQWQTPESRADGSNTMRILVVGAGAIGGYFGGRLAEAGRDVTFLVREGRAGQLRQQGLTLISPHGDVTIQPKLVTADTIDTPYDAVIVGASFAGLACAAALASRGASVTVLDRKREPGEKLHTTGILVRDVLDQVPLLDGLPSLLVRRIDHVRLYAPGMQYIDLSAPDYYFLATDTPGLMRWLADRAAQSGARFLWGCPFRRAWATR